MAKMWPKKSQAVFESLRICCVEKNSRATSGLVCKGQRQLVMSAVGKGLEYGRYLPSEIQG